MKENCEREELSPETVVRILEKHGEKMSVQEAAEMLKILNPLVNIAVGQYLSDG